MICDTVEKMMMGIIPSVRVMIRLVNSPEAVAQAIKTRFLLWYGQWFLDTTEGTPWIQSVLGKQKPDTYNLAIRKRILETQGLAQSLHLIPPLTVPRAV